MKRKDFFRIAVFILIFVLFSRGLLNLFVAWTRQSSGYQRTSRHFEAVQDQVSVIVLGDSHSEYSLMAGKIEGAYNFSSGGENVILTYSKIRYYLERGNFHPQVAIVSIDPHLFSSFRLRLIPTQDPAFWGRYMNYVSYGLKTEALPQMLAALAEANFGFLGGIDMAFDQLCCSSQADPDISIAGFAPVQGDFSIQSSEEQAEHAIHTSQTHFKSANYPDELVLDYFFSLLDLLELYDVQVVFVWYPVTEIYYEMSDEYIPIDSHLSIVKDLLADRQSTLILDYHDLFFEQPYYFFNSDHINASGAEAFTEILIEDLTEAGVLPVFSEEN